MVLEREREKREITYAEQRDISFQQDRELVNPASGFPV